METNDMDHESLLMEGMFMEHDFQERTVLGLITELGYEALFQDPKVSRLLDALWMGKASKTCEGKI